MAAMKLLSLALLGTTAFAKVYFEETFDSTWEKRWTPSTWKKSEGTAGEFKLTAGKFFGDEEKNKGIQTGPDARFYAISSKLPEPIADTTGKDLVLQFSVKMEEKIDCGGGYIKLLPTSSDMKGFGGETPYSIMFGPDICGYSTKRVHVIFDYKGKQLLTKKTIPCETDELTHVYTLIVKPDNTYQVLIDNEEKAAGKLEEDWDFLEPRTIPDPKATKPDDWDEREYIPDETDVKPAGWDDIKPEIVDESAKKPEDWDDADDGEWEAPLIPNPEYKGEWRQKEKKNPDYKGIWKAPEIDNPKYVPDEHLYVRKDIGYVGFELWQVKSGTIFDNILFTDDIAYAKKFAEDTWGKLKEAEKKAFDKFDEEKKANEEAERKKLEEEAKAAGEEEDGEEEEHDHEDHVHDEL